MTDHISREQQKLAEKFRQAEAIRQQRQSAADVIVIESVPIPSHVQAAIQRNLRGGPNVRRSR